MKRKITCLLLAAMLLLITACSGGGAAPTTTANSANQPSATANDADASSSSGGDAETGDDADATQVPGEVATILMGGWGEIEDAYAPSTVGMEEAIGIKVEFQKYPTDADFWNNLPAQIAANTAPQMANVTNELYLQYIKSKLFVPLDDYIADGTIVMPDDMPDVLKDVWTIDDQFWGMPFQIVPACFNINKGMWEEAGLTEADYPETWDDVYEIMKNVAAEGIVDTPLCFNTQEFHFTNYCLSFGGGWNEGQTIDTPENAEALQWVIDRYREGLVVTPKELGVDYDGTVVMQRNALFSTGGTWYLADFRKNAPEEDVVFIPVPSAAGKNASGTLHVTSVCILGNNDLERETAQAINYMYQNEEGQRYRMENHAYITSSKKYWDEWSTFQPELGGLIDRIDVSNGFQYPVDGKMFADELISRMEAILFDPSNTTTAAEMLADLAAAREWYQG